MASRRTITIVPSAIRDIHKIPRGKAATVTDAISALATDPTPFGHEVVEERPNTYKIRVGDYTVEYELIDEDIVKILIISL